jgi:hypothetical protein
VSVDGEVVVKVGVIEQTWSVPSKVGHNDMGVEAPVDYIAKNGIPA